ncbi:DUF481 domain-containing protein [Seonamhaeicola sp.]|uniref:DUF481 domain-containing protein n=1 Tax=Seonamhaeicola sp. TaxID=1912245 RepID=UPI00261E369B|nr:DUF481 domain-containing protein [Seonamhaeicola sp.]
MIIISILALVPFCLLGQTDSLKVEARVGVRGKWQTGNLAQFVINPNAGLTFKKNNNQLEFQGNYEFLKVNQGSLINDFWTYGIYQYQVHNTLFPIVMIHYGYSQAYAIDNSLIGGLGFGVNLMPKNHRSYIQTNLFIGHLNIKYQDVSKHKGTSLGSYVKLKFPIVKESLEILLDAQAYLSLKDTAYSSFNSRIIFLFKLINNFGFDLTYNLVYTNNNPSVTSKANGKLIFGLNYSFK